MCPSVVVAAVLRSSTPSYFFLPSQFQPHTYSLQQVDGFLARVAAAALTAAAKAAGVEDVAPDELPLPRIATYEELKAFIEARVAQCERCVVCLVVGVCCGVCLVALGAKEMSAVFTTTPVLFQPTRACMHASMPHASCLMPHFKIEGSAPRLVTHVSYLTILLSHYTSHSCPLSQGGLQRL